MGAACSARKQPTLLTLSHGDVHGAALALFDALDTDGDGRVSADELAKHLHGRRREASALLHRLDLDGDGKVSIRELHDYMRRTKEDDSRFDSLLASVVLPPRSCDFSDLMHQGRRRRIAIKDVAHRAMTVAQLVRVSTHVRSRLDDRIFGGGGEKWFRERGDGAILMDVPLCMDPPRADGRSETPSPAVNMYDLLRYVVNPATQPHSCSLVELMATDEQPADYFVSHVYGEPFVDLVAAVKHHAWVRGLDGNTHSTGRPPAYWLCAFAGQVGRALGGQPLNASPFYAAMQASRGFVCLVDSAGRFFERLWNVYELHTALTGDFDSVGCEYTYDIVVAPPARAQARMVAVTGPRLTARQKTIRDKLDQERDFPWGAVKAALDPRSPPWRACGKCSKPSDRLRLLAAMGDDHASVDATIRGGLAAALLPAALDAAGAQAQLCLEAVWHGRNKQLHICFAGTPMDSAAGWGRVLQGFCHEGSSVRRLVLVTRLASFPSLAFTSLPHLLHLELTFDNQVVAAIPDDLFAPLVHTLNRPPHTLRLFLLAMSQRGTRAAASHLRTPTARNAPLMRRRSSSPSPLYAPAG